jgi:hypothetical protein
MDLTAKAQGLRALNSFAHFVGPNGVRPRASAAGPYKFAALRCPPPSFCGRSAGFL